MPDHASEQPLPQLMSLATGYWASAALAAAVALGLFDCVDEAGEHGASADDIASSLNTGARHTAALLDVLTGLDLLAKVDRRYTLAPAMRPYLSRHGAMCMLDALRFNTDMYPLWGRLADCVREGEPVASAQAHLGEDAARTRRFVMGMHSRALPMADAVAGAIDLGGVTALLDLGAGPGTYGRAIAQRYPALTVTQFDLPPVVSIARELAKGHPAADRIRYVEGDYRADALPGGFDAVLYCGALHQESPQTAARLFDAIAAGLERGGRLIVIDMLLDDDAARPAFSALFSLNMMLVSPIARVFTARQAEGLLSDAGFDVRATQAIEHTPYWIVEAQRR